MFLMKPSNASSSSVFGGCFALRSGAKGLKKSQVYPKGYAEKIVKLHMSFLVA